MVSPRTLLTVAVGDIHGRFHRVDEWVSQLEKALGRAADLVLAVGDVEAFARADDHRRKAAKRAMPAEFSAYAGGARKLLHPLHFIGGNNEDFEALHGMQEGGLLIPGVHYLGRAGAHALGGLQVAGLSGIFAPRFYEQPLAEPRTRDTVKQAGYFRKAEVEGLTQRVARAAPDGLDLLLVHEWPRGITHSSVAGAASGGSPQGQPSTRPRPRPWMGNRITQSLVERLKPRWLFCGHSHMPWAATLRHAGGQVTRVTCLDQAARSEGAIFWVEWQGHVPWRAGWGVEGQVAWQENDPWDARAVPATFGEGELSIAAE